MSKFGRDYLQVGHYTELIFPSRDVRFIAVNGGVDSARGDNDFTPFRNLFNDFYAKDTSKKSPGGLTRQRHQWETHGEAALRLPL